MPGCPLDPGLIDRQQWCFDAVYTPIKTEFLAHCERKHVRTITGFELFLYQGLDSFEFWSRIKVDEVRARAAFMATFDLNEPNRAVFDRHGMHCGNL